MSEAASQDPFFIIGTGRCGTTLLQRMLMGHPRISIPPETHFFSRFDPVRVVGLDPVSDGLVEGYVERCASHPWFAELGLRRESLQAALDAGTRSARDLFLWYANALLPDAPARLGEKTPHHEKYTARADVYSFGVVMWELATRCSPYESMTPYQVGHFAQHRHTAHSCISAKL